MKVLCVVLISIGMMATSDASAQNRYSDAHFFRPALYAGGLFAVDRATIGEKWRPSFKFFFNHEGVPLRLTFPDGQQDIISSAQVFNLQAQFVAASWLELGMDLPVVRQSYTSNPAEGTEEGYERLSAYDLKSNIPAPNVSPLDFRIGMKINMLDSNGLGLALSVQGSIPFGDELYFAGEKNFTIHPKLLASLERGPLLLAVNLGGRFRERNTIYWKDPETQNEGEIPLLDIGHELTFGVGAGYRLHRMIGLGAEIYGAIPLAGSSYEIESRRLEVDSSQCPAGSPPDVPCEIVTARQIDPPSSPVVEALGGLILSPKTGLDIAVGAGAGLSGGDRRVALRIFAGISWLPGAEGAGDKQDRDNDGIIDSEDRCPGEAEDMDGVEDEDGCPELDDDGDGIIEGDKCPKEAEDPDGFQDEDGCPEEDNDGDGIVDLEDKCPDKPEDMDKFQDEDGCPDEDNDGDGIADVSDQCPIEAETANGYQDSDGCPDNVAGVVVRKDKIEIPEKVRFTRGKAVITKGSFKLLDEIAKKILGAPQVGQIRIEGHCDSSGTAEANQRLSQGRADAVKNYIVRKGVPASRLQAVGYGSSRSIAPNNTKEGRAKNRRVEFIIVEAK